MSGVEIIFDRSNKLRAEVALPMSVVEERYAVSYRIDILDQPVVKLSPHARCKLADEA